MTVTAPAGRAPAHVGYRDIFAIAVPIMLSNASTPMIGFVDAAVVGQLGVPALIGGVAMASLMFNAIYWAFGFLRMSTTGFAAQAYGARDASEVAATLARALLIGVAIGVVIVALQVPIRQAFFWFLGGSPEVQGAARAYFDWRIYATPAGFIQFALLGWLIGLGRASQAFMLQLGMNLLNMFLAVAFTQVWHWGVAGVGIAALVAEWVAALAGLAMVGHELRSRGAALTTATLSDRAKLASMFAANRDILIRTVCVLATSQLFVRMSAAQGDVALAANALLLNILYINYYLLDGYANAAETLVGQAIGARDRTRLDSTVTRTFVAGGITAALLGIALMLFGGRIIAFMTTNSEVQRLAVQVLPFVAFMPAVAIWCFVYDGIFIGATRTVDMRNMMLLSFAMYLAALALLVPPFANLGIWAAHAVFFIVRAVTLRAKYPAVAASAGPRARQA